MSREPTKGEPGEDAAVRARLEKIQRDKRSGVRWNLSRHTAEQALMAITDLPPRGPYRASGKNRRRKKHKRLL